MTSYLTDAEELALQMSSLHRRTPFLICGVSQSQFSIARHSGGCTFNGDHFEYLPETDELIRSDARKEVTKFRKLGSKPERKRQRSKT